jgi:phosphoribosylaminoimidazole carboxylase PurE protein
MPVIAVVMGSKSDLPNLKGAFDIFKNFQVDTEVRVISAHRTPEEALDFASNAKKRGFKIIICAAGMAAHLAGVMAAHTSLPVIGIPMASEPFNGMDSLLATVQMPPGIPVATVTVGKCGGKNAALFAMSILALNDDNIQKKLDEFRNNQTESVKSLDAEVSKEYSLKF